MLKQTIMNCLVFLFFLIQNTQMDIYLTPPCFVTIVSSRIKIDMFNKYVILAGQLELNTSIYYFIVLSVNLILNQTHL